MTQHFEIGEVVTLAIDKTITPEHLFHFSGQDCEIRSALDEWMGEDGLMFGYWVRMPSGFDLLAESHELRRKPPKADDIAWAHSKVMDLFSGMPVEIL